MLLRRWSPVLKLLNPDSWLIWDLAALLYCPYLPSTYAWGPRAMGRGATYPVALAPALPDISDNLLGCWMLPCLTPQLPGRWPKDDRLPLSISRLRCFNEPSTLFRLANQRKEGLRSGKKEERRARWG